MDSASTMVSIGPKKSSVRKSTFVPNTMDPIRMSSEIKPSKKSSSINPASVSLIKLELDTFKSSQKLKIPSAIPSEASSRGFLSLKSDETGPVPIEDETAKGCQTKKSDVAGKNLTTEDYLKSQEAENLEVTAANLHAVESLAPFSLKRVYGRLENVPAVNLTGIYRNHVAYATSNVVVIFDYFENTQHCLQGHRNAITSLEIEKKGRFMVSADSGVRSLIIVWDTMTGKPVKFLPDVHSNLGALYACFTGVDYTFASIGAEEMSKQTICFWNFDAKHATAKLPNLVGNFPTTTSIIRELSFLEGKPEFFSATGDRNVIFGTWIRDKKGPSVHFHKPKLRKSFIAKHKRFTSSLWMKNGDWLVTATGSGFVLIWGSPVVLALEDPPDPTKNIREFSRSFKLCEDGITFFTILNEYVVIGDEIGIVRFFDHDFKLLRWSKAFQLPAILHVSFNRSDEITEFKKKLRAKYNESTKDHLHRGNACVRDYTLGGKKYQRPLSQTTIPRPPMPCPDFVLGCRGGDVYYYHFKENQLDRLIPGTPGNFVTVDICPGSNHVLFSTRNGEIQMYEFKTHKLMFNDKIFSGKHKISTMKFHPMGQFIAFGLIDGHVCFRKTYTWKTAMQPLSVTSERVIRIIYTADGLHMAYFDSDRTVVVFKYLAKGKGWMSLGKSRAHKDDIVDLQFFLDSEMGQNRLFSLGRDRHLIEYDIERSSEETGVFIVKITNLEETCCPTAMVFDGPPEFGVDCITFSNDINKLRLFSYQEERVRTTCAGPVFGRDKGISRMVEFAVQMSEDRLKKFIVYVVRNKLGIMDTPIDGNPHKYMAVFTHPRDIIEVAVASDRERLFTVGRDDNSAFSWEASPRAVEATVLMGGSGVEPFYHTLRRLWGGGCQDIIKDLDMVFFFLNVKRIEKQTEIYSMNRNIRICEIPAVCRACGFFPSEYEVSLMVEEARHLKRANQHYTDDFSTEFSFDEFVKLFVNHFYRVTDEDVYEAFKVLGFDEEEQDEEAYICRSDFVKYLSEEGEAIRPHDFPVYFQPMYEIQEPGKFAGVKCHTVEEESSSLSTTSSVSSVSIVDVVNSAESQSSSSSEHDAVPPPAPQVQTDEEEEEEEEMTVQNPVLPPEEEEKDRGSDEEIPDRKKSAPVVQGQKTVRLAPEIVQEPQAQPIAPTSSAPPTPAASATATGAPPTKGKKSIRMNEVTEEFEYEQEKGFDNEEGEGEEEEADEDDMVDLPERIDLSYFLDVMLPQDCQQTIPWKPKSDKEKGEELPGSAKRKKEEKEVLRTLLKQIVDPGYPVPKKLLNSLLAEYYLEHGNFAIPPDLQYPGIPIPTSWYADVDDEDEEWDEESSSPSGTTTSTTESSAPAPETEYVPAEPDAMDEAEADEVDEEGSEAAPEEEEEEEMAEMGEHFDPGELEYTYSVDVTEMQEGDEESLFGEYEGEGEDQLTYGGYEEEDRSMFGEHPTEERSIFEAQPTEERSLSEGLDDENKSMLGGDPGQEQVTYPPQSAVDELATEGEEEGFEGSYTPPFTVSDLPVSAQLELGHHSDGTEEMTDLDNVYEEEDLEFVRNVNQSFRQSLKTEEGDARRKSSLKDKPEGVGGGGGRKPSTKDQP